MFMTVKEAAKYLNLSLNGVYYTIMFELVDACHIRSCWRVTEESVKAYAERRDNKQTQTRVTPNNGYRHLGPLFAGGLPNNISEYSRPRTIRKTPVRTMDHTTRRRHRMDEQQLELVM